MNSLINIKDLTIRQLVALIPLGYCVECDNKYMKKPIYLKGKGCFRPIEILKGINGYVSLIEETDESYNFVASSLNNNFKGWNKEVSLRFLKNFMRCFSKRTTGIDFDTDYIVTGDEDEVFLLIPSWNEASNGVNFERVATYNVKDKTLKASYEEAFKFIKRLLEEFSKINNKRRKQ